MSGIGSIFKTATDKPDWIADREKLFSAIKKGNVQAMLGIINTHGEIAFTWHDEKGYGVLATAADHFRPAAFTALLDAGANLYEDVICISYPSKSSPLLSHLVSCSKPEKLVPYVEALLAKGTDPHRSGTWETTRKNHVGDAFYFAREWGNFGMIDVLNLHKTYRANYLAEQSKKLNPPPSAIPHWRDDRDALFKAIKDNKSALIKTIMARQPEAPTWVNDKNEGILRSAYEGLKYESFIALLDGGANIEEMVICKEYPTYGQPLLAHMVSGKTNRLKKDAPFVEALLARGADPHKTGSWKFGSYQTHSGNAFYFANEMNHRSMVNILDLHKTYRSEYLAAHNEDIGNKVISVPSPQKGSETIVTTTVEEQMRLLTDQFNKLGSKVDTLSAENNKLRQEVQQLRKQVEETNRIGFSHAKVVRKR